jgi:hypothetical protein
VGWRKKSEQKTHAENICGTAAWGRARDAVEVVRKMDCMAGDQTCQMRGES